MLNALDRQRPIVPTILYTLITDATYSVATKLCLFDLCFRKAWLLVMLLARRQQRSTEDNRSVCEIE